MNDGWGMVIAAAIGLIPTMLTFVYAKKTHTKVATNHHTSDPPTIPDRLDNLEKGQAKANSDISELKDLVIRHIVWQQERDRTR